MNSIKCKASQDDHILEEPLELPCKINICRKCYKFNELCFNCNQEHNINKVKINELAIRFIKDDIEILSKNFENENMERIKSESN
jgi:hypothetical protein